jgi:hypothetical protein
MHGACVGTNCRSSNILRRLSKLVQQGGTVQPYVALAIRDSFRELYQYKVEIELARIHVDGFLEPRVDES